MAEDHFYAEVPDPEHWDAGWLFDGLVSFPADSIPHNDAVPDVDDIDRLEERFSLGEPVSEIDIENIDLLGDDENIANLTVDTETAENVEKAIQNGILLTDEPTDDGTDAMATHFLCEELFLDISAFTHAQIRLEVVHPHEFGTLPVRVQPQPELEIVKTRSGRVSKPTAQLTQEVRRAVQTEATKAARIAQRKAFETTVPAEAAGAPPPKRTMTVADGNRCATCGKMYVGKRIQRHLLENPGHKTCEQVAHEQWAATDSARAGPDWAGFWMDILRNHQLVPGGTLPPAEQGHRLTQALSAMVQTVRRLYPPAMVPCTAQTEGAMYVDKHMAELLATRTGFYRVEPSADKGLC